MHQGRIAMKMKKILRLGVFVILLGIWANATPAGAAFFDFENLPSPGPTPLVLPGVTFTPLHEGGVATTNWPFEPGSKSYYVTGLPDHVLPVLNITFDSEVFLVKFNFNDDGISIVNALDSNNNLLDSSCVGPGQQQVVLCAKGIKSVVIIGSINIKYIDNFSFYPLAPGETIIPTN